VEELSDGQAALRRIEHKPMPNILLLDAVMDEMDGFELCRRIRKNPHTANLPVLMLTGLDDVVSVNKAFEVGATGFVTKPVNIPILLQRIQFVLRAHHAESELREKRAWLNAAQRVARMGYWRWEPDNGDFELSEQLASMTGLDRDQFSGIDAYIERAHPEDRARLRRYLDSALQEGTATSLNYRLLTEHGPPLVVCQELELKKGDAAETLLLATVQDISRQQAAEEQILKLAYFDALTGLASRAYFQKRLEDSIKSAKRRNERFALLFLDLDNFKDVNDSLGHDVGDHLLTIIGRRLQRILRDCDFAARFGGDEFCLLIDAIKDQFDAAEVAERCLRTIDEVIDLGGRKLRPQASLGIALYPRDGKEAQILLKAADSAMYAAKRSGKHRYAFYTQQMTEQAKRRLGLEQQLRKAVEQQEFELHYQPQIDLNSGGLAGVEALVRWRHPDRGLVLPGEFIQVIERIGLIPSLGQWVLEQACLQLAQWDQMELPRFGVSVNVSPIQCRDQRIIDVVREAIKMSAIDAQRLELEITESTVLTTDKNMRLFDDMKALGVSIAIDDFGVGYSSLSSLQKLPIDTLKVDRLFLVNVMDKPKNALLLGAIIELAHALGHSVVAEGAEHIEQIQLLSDFACDQVQGYYFSKPVPAQQIPALARTAFPIQRQAPVSQGAIGSKLKQATS
jgi:diguanylate cyclase (GGDEF)-like protein